MHKLHHQLGLNLLIIHLIQIRTWRMNYFNPLILNFKIHFPIPYKISFQELIFISPLISPLHQVNYIFKVIIRLPANFFLCLRQAQDDVLDLSLKIFYNYYV